MVYIYRINSRLLTFQTVEFSTDEQKIEGFGLMQKKDPESGAHTQI